MDNDQTGYGKEVQAILRQIRGETQDDDITQTRNQPNVPFSQPACTSNRWQQPYGRGSNGLQTRLYGHGVDQVELQYRPRIPHQQTTSNANRAPEQHGESPNDVRSHFHRQQEPYQSRFDPSLADFMYSQPDDHLDDYG